MADNYMEYFQEEQVPSIETIQLRDQMTYKEEDMSSVCGILQPEYLNLSFNHEPLPQVLNYLAQHMEGLPNSDAHHVSTYPVSSNDKEIGCTKVIEKNKRIMKREKAKSRKQAKQQVTKAIIEEDLSNNNTQNIELNERIAQEVGKYEHLDDKSKKKMVQMIRNRISAQNSRDRKKGYITTLESENFTLKHEQQRLMSKIAQLEEKLAACQNCKRCGALESNSTSDDGEHIDILNNGPMSHVSRGGNGGHFAMISLLGVILLIGLVSMSSGTNGGPSGGETSLVLHNGNSRILTANTDVMLPVSRTIPEEVPMKAAKAPVHCNPFALEEEMDKKYAQKFIKLKEEFDERIRQCQKCQEKDDVKPIQPVAQHKKKFLGIESKQLAPYDYFNSNSQPVPSSSLLCPSSVLIQPINASNDEGESPRRGNAITRLHETQWLQVLLPKQNITMLSGEMEPPILINNQEEMKEEGENNMGKGQMLELICKVNSIREFNI